MEVQITTLFPTAQVSADSFTSAFVVNAGETSKLNQFGQFSNSVWSTNTDTGALVLDSTIDSVNRDTLLNVAKAIAPLLSANNDNVVEIRCQFDNSPSIEDFGVIVKYVTDAYKVVPIDVDYVEGTPMAVA